MPSRCVFIIAIRVWRDPQVAVGGEHVTSYALFKANPHQLLVDFEEPRIFDCPRNIPDEDPSAEATYSAQSTSQAFKQFADQGPLAAILFYSWSGVLPFSWDKVDANGKADPCTIFRCRALTDAGKLALDPL